MPPGHDAAALPEEAEGFAAGAGDGEAGVVTAGVEEVPSAPPELFAGLSALTVDVDSPPEAGVDPTVLDVPRLSVL
jgi:hypothetical protein